MKDWTKRFSLAALLGFLVFVFALPVSCSGIVLYNEHRFGEVEANGPAAVLGGMGIAAVLALLVMAWIWRKSRPR